MEKKAKAEGEILIEKAFFKSKFLFHASWILLLIYAIILIIASLYKPSVYTILWSAIYLTTFMVVVSKHRNTVLFLKMLAAIAMGILVVQYILHFSTEYYFSFAEELISLLKEDYKIIILFLLILFFGDDLIERRLIKK